MLHGFLERVDVVHTSREVLYELRHQVLSIGLFLVSVKELFDVDHFVEFGGPEVDYQDFIWDEVVLLEMLLECCWNVHFIELNLTESSVLIKLFSGSKLQR